jgi:hypothetical protein
MYFQVKNILKNNHHYTLKHAINDKKKKANNTDMHYANAT